MRRAETFTPPSAAQYAAGVTYTASCHASGGPLGIQYDPNASPQDVERAFNQTVQGQGLPYVTDLTCGNPAGAAPIANTRSGNTRNDACESSTKEGKAADGKTAPTCTPRPAQISPSCQAPTSVASLFRLTQPRALPAWSSKMKRATPTALKRILR